jgi:hypothetical protein
MELKPWWNWELLWIVALKQRGHPFEQSGVNFQKYTENGLNRQTTI